MDIISAINKVPPNSAAGSDSFHAVTKTTPGSTQKIKTLVHHSFTYSGTRLFKCIPASQRNKTGMLPHLQEPTTLTSGWHTSRSNHQHQAKQALI
ncbi:hypothetical protein E2C01_038008 [Portunus trituberculatus]|uniref:Uncharacterized protein n=1 Tax=Portunus trituberculatus TaxID=210409 RepID=A0A5B7FFL9_PORTR|nr:hypothetical protein [Portunus trituberculatus]